MSRLRGGALEGGLRFVIEGSSSGSNSVSGIGAIEGEK